MPKIVDHERRREEIAALTLRVMRSAGIEKATIRAIARHGRISMGVLSHYFNSKDELVGFTFRWLAERTFAELDTLVRAAPAGLAGLQAALEYMLPRSGKATDFALWMTLWGRAASNPRLAREHRSYYARWRRCIRSLLAAARARGEMSARLSTDDATDLLVATVDGLWIDCVLEPRRFRSARRRRLLRELLGAVSRASAGRSQAAGAARQARPALAVAG